MTYTRKQIEEAAGLHERAWGEDPDIPPIHHMLLQLLAENERLEDNSFCICDNASDAESGLDIMERDGYSASVAGRVHSHIKNILNLVDDAADEVARRIVDECDAGEASND